MARRSLGYQMKEQVILSVQQPFQVITFFDTRYLVFQRDIWRDCPTGSHFCEAPHEWGRLWLRWKFLKIAQNMPPPKLERPKSRWAGGRKRSPLLPSFSVYLRGSLFQGKVQLFPGRSMSSVAATVGKRRLSFPLNLRGPFS